MLPGDAVVEGHSSRRDGVRSQRHGLGACRRDEADELLHVAGREAVRRAGEALRA
jgi:hypothetical protein